MPLQVWVQAVALGLKTIEVPVELIYLDESRAFGGSLDDATFRLQHYRRVFGLGGLHGRNPPDRHADQDMQQDRQRQGGGRHVLQSRRDESDVVGHGDPVLRAVGVGG